MYHLTILNNGRIIYQKTLEMLLNEAIAYVNEMAEADNQIVMARVDLPAVYLVTGTNFGEEHYNIYVLSVL